MNKIIVTTKKEIEELKNCSAMAWEGMNIEDNNLQAIIDTCGVNDNIYIIKGETMNKAYKLTDDNAYFDDLNIVALDGYKGLAIIYGARWMDDIIANNNRRQRVLNKERKGEKKYE